MARAGVERVVHRQRVLLVISTCALVIALVGLGLSYFIKSPAQQVVDQGPPPPSVITAPVEHRVMQAQVSLRGTMVAADLIDVSGSATGAGDANSKQIVTGMYVSAGQSIESGAVVAQIAGRPMIALLGRVPAYRTMGPGMTGEDVRGLQQALIALRYLAESNDTGFFGDLTQSAVEALYRDRGYEPAHTWDGGNDDLKAAQQIVTQQQRLLDDSRAKAKADPSDENKRLVSRDQEDLLEALDRLKQVQARSGVQVNLGEVFFVPSFPATVTRIPVAVGADLSKAGDTVLTLSCGQVVAQGVLPAGQETGISAGNAVEIIDGVNSRRAAGTVAAVGPYQTTPRDPATGLPIAGGAAGYPVAIAPDEAVDQSWIGSNVQLTITSATTDQPVLVVPTLAIRVDSQNQTNVLVATENNSTRIVHVETGFSAGGMTQAEPTKGDLSEGDRVVIG